ncbi:MAG TPA: protein kinase [Gemmatimonadaceae bacterium]|nr:protein kinase [Gemmatimonadaceae bacterium]
MDSQKQLQNSLGSAYTIERELGGGGMSRVFLAQETALGRKVVIKVLPADLSAGVNVDRFNREVHLAASLQQAQIVPVLTAGEVDGVPFYTMPFVEGESLRARLGRDGALPISQVINILRDVTRALAYAHEHGVVHRDIKPDNVLLSGGTAVVTDFGIAKAISAARASTTDTALTQVGTSVGTPAYISPEQAAGDPNIDHRADLYSLGCMAYELLTGQPPFAGRTPQRTLAAHLTEVPADVTAERPDVPPLLATVVMQCLEKDPASRPQSAREIGEVLDTVTTGSTASSPAMLLHGPGAIRRALLIYIAAFAIVVVLAKASLIAFGVPDWVFSGAVILMSAGLPVLLAVAFAHHTTRRVATRTAALTPGGTLASHGTVTNLALKVSPHLTWRRVFRGVAVAVGAFAAAVVAIMVLRLFGVGPAASLLAAGTLHGRERVLVADFAARNDTSLSHLVTEAVRTNLNESSVISIMPPSAIAAALVRMQRPSITTVDLPLAREIAQREGVKAIVAGGLTPLAGGYVVSIRLVAADSGNELAAFRKTVDAPSQLLDAIDDLTRKLRGRIGESLKSVREAPALDQVTTGSLEALRKYAEANRAFDLEGDYTKAASLLREAVAKDTTFAMAYRKLGVTLSNNGMPRPQVDSALTRALQYSKRLPEKERYLAIGTYYDIGPGWDRRKAGDAFQQVLNIDSTDVAALNNLANDLRSLRQYARAESLYHVIVMSPRAPQVAFGNYAGTLFLEGKLARSESAYNEMRRRFPATTVQPYPLFAYQRGQYDSAEAYWRARRNDANPIVKLNAVFTLSSFAVLRGRLREARALLAQGREANAARGVPSRPLDDSIDAVSSAIWFYDQRDAGVRRIDAALARTPLKTLSYERRPYMTTANAYAMAGRPDKARALVAEYDADVHDTAFRIAASPIVHITLAEIALAEKRPLDAVREFWKSDSLPDGPASTCEFCTEMRLGRAFDLANLPDSAIGHWERYLAATSSGRLGLDAGYLAGVRKRLGELYEAKGDNRRAATNYLAFIELWKNADPELQPKVLEARERLARLKDRSGK